MVSEGVIDEWFAYWSFLRFLCRTDLYFFGTEILGYGGSRVDPVFNRWFCRELSVEEDTLFLLPREHTKTTWGITIRVTQDILQDSNRAIFIGSITNEQAQKNLRVVKGHLTNTKVAVLFPEIICEDPVREGKRASSSPYKGIRWRDDQIIVRRDTQRREPTVETGGVDQFKTGNHFDREYFDDLINEVVVASDTQSRKVEEFVKYFVPMITPGGIRRFYGTIYDQGDYYHHLMQRITSDDPLEKMNMRVVHREVLETYEQYTKHQPLRKRTFGHRAVSDPLTGDKKIFIYSFFDLDYLAKKRSDVGSDVMFIAQYYNRATSDEQRYFPPPYEETESLPNDLIFYMTVDPAFTVTKQSDYSAFVVCGYNSGPLAYVAEALRVKALPDDFVDTLYDLQARYDCKVIGMESGAWQSVMAWIIEYSRKQLELERLPIKPLTLRKEINAKQNRIRGLSYFVKKGIVTLRSGLDDLKREMMRYPGNTRSKDDLLDALAMQKELVSWKRGESTVRPEEVQRRLNEQWQASQKKTYRDYMSEKKQQKRSYTSY